MDHRFGKSGRLPAAALLLLAIVPQFSRAEGGSSTKQDRSQAVDPLNQGLPPTDWWGEIKRRHGHVNPWCILGLRIGETALREFETKWGAHELEIICYSTPQAPQTGLFDGLAIGTGNSAGRLDLRLAEVFDSGQLRVAVRRKDGAGALLEFIPNAEYLRHIAGQPVENYESLARANLNLPYGDIFSIVRLQPLDGVRHEAGDSQ